jgi:hypothetical protein
MITKNYIRKWDRLLLTLIRMAGGVYDSWNFEQVKLHNALKIHMQEIL